MAKGSWRRARSKRYLLTQQRCPGLLASSKGRTSLRVQALRLPWSTDLVGQALLLPRDMAEFRTFKKHEVFMFLKRDLAMVRLQTLFPLLDNLIFLL